MRRLTRRTGSDDGAALVMVLGVASVMILLAASLVAYAVGSQRNARADQDWNAALAAAYAGVEEYQSRLANNPDYFAWGNEDSTFTDASGSVVAPPPAGAENPAFSVSPSATEWAPVPYSDGSASFRYEVDNSRFYLDGTLRLRSTGRADGKTRTIVADLRQAGFIDFLYFTDYEIQDPDLSGVNKDDCVRYGHGVNARPFSGCSEIAFYSGDTLKGPVHSNDAIRSCEAKFLGHTTTAYNPAPPNERYRAMNYLATPCGPSTFAVNPGGPAYQATIGMPKTNGELKLETRHDLLSQVPRPGCLFTGPTDITLLANGNMRVISPWTRHTSSSPTPFDNDGCGTPGSAGLGKTTGGGPNRRYVGEEIPVPDRNIVYVQDVPSMSTDPNYAPPGRKPVGSNQVSCDSDTSNNVGFPYESGGKTEATPLWSTATNPAYGCRNGDVFVQGVLDGEVTIAAENYVYVTGDVQYKDSQDDILGLIGNDAVFVWNPMYWNGSDYRVMLTDHNRRIDAAILSVAHTFQAQNYGRGGPTKGFRGELNINGALAQKFRGIVQDGVYGYGYAKNYVYDERFRYTAPPKYLAPVTTTYRVSTWAEIRPVFDVNGEYR